jgi:hypothetical protein
MANAGRTTLDFTAYLAERTARFTGREWMLRAVDDWLADGAERLFLLTGEPGAGKTALAGRLVQISGGAVPPPDRSRRLGPGFLGAWHFCTAGDRHWLNPRVYAESLAAQIAARHQA